MSYVGLGSLSAILSSTTYSLQRSIMTSGCLQSSFSKTNALPLEGEEGCNCFLKYDASPNCLITKSNWPTYDSY